MRDPWLPVSWWEAAALVGALSGCAAHEAPSAPPPRGTSTGPASTAAPTGAPTASAPPADSAPPPAVSASNQPPEATRPQAGSPASGAPPPPYAPPADRLAECVDDHPNVLRALVPSVFDYAELRLEGFGSQTVMAAGTPCEKATDRAACDARLRRVIVETTGVGFNPGCRPGSCAHRLVVTRGDAVRELLDYGAVREAVGAVGSREEAMLVAFTDGYRFPGCEEFAAKLVPRGTAFQLTTEVMISDCPIQMARRVVRIEADGALLTVSEQKLPKGRACIGRLPPGLVDDDGVDDAASAEGAELARCFRLEAAAVAAFERLALELALHGAPTPLVAEALVARDDELRHARVVGALAHRYGARVRWPRVRALPPRSLEAMLEDNAAEGCVRETFGALVGLAQAAGATDPTVRAAMGPIARDEVRHARLSWRVARALEARLTPTARRRVAAAREAAALGLAAGEGWVTEQRALGLPGAEAQHALAARFSGGLLGRAGAAA